MAIAESDLPPYPVREVLAKPFPERMRLVARTWAAQIQPNSRAVLALYWLKYFLVFIGGWACFCSFDADYPGFASAGAWAFSQRRVPEGARLVDVLRAARPRLRDGPHERPLLASARRLPALPAPRDDEARAISGPAAARRDHAQLAGRRSLRRAPDLPAARARRSRGDARAAAADLHPASDPRHRRQDALPVRARRALLGRAGVPRRRACGRRLDLRVQADLGLHLVLGGHLEAQSPFPVRDHGDDEQRPLLPVVAQAAALRRLPGRSAALGARRRSWPTWAPPPST